jgi:Predicted signal transduction protein containing sensor and EAL domains
MTARRRRVTGILVATIILVTVIPSAVLLGVTYLQTLRTAEHALVRTVERYVNRANLLLETADHVLHRLRKEAGAVPAGELQRHLAQLVYDDPRFREAGVVDAGGNLVVTNFGLLQPPLPVPTDARADPANPNLQVIGLVRTVLMQEKSIVVALPTDGGGEVNVLIDPRVLRGYPNETDLGPGGFLAFATADGRLLTALGTPPVKGDRLQTQRAPEWIVDAGESNRGDIRIVAEVSRDWVLRDWHHNLWLVVGTSLACNAGLIGVLRWLTGRSAGLDHDLRVGMAAGEFSVVYQPIVELQGRRCVGVEALLRWQHRHHGAVSPEVFVPLAERTGQIEALTACLLKAVVRDLAPILQRYPSLWVSINTPLPLIFAGTISRLVGRAISGTALSAERFHFEITERQLQEDQVQAIGESMADLRRQRIQCSLDDFGTGSCGMTHLLVLDFSYLKLDKSYVRSIGSDSRAAIVLDALIDMSRRLKLIVVAEGIEKPEQADYLRAANVPLGQGWLFAVPLAAPMLSLFLAEHPPG